ncbi:beta-fructofuranosidase [Microbacterium endophyticum]|uniref:Beta-fructofuranosidase n=1 Tax=Microbacterium endophyticum TaxID=1526412 RepID=A0A7W4V6J3_9MICO|nr:glycosyl hydrolase family 32 [Microbacterium endophyticum]MBB2977135.1 beta-fructofuranosidase [Microbacterium endophyticum]NIK36063.1 beta-fructofuranosidase [Microbacterium endophyticum]
MTFTTPDRWVWDFWIADDGEQFHLFYLNAPRSLGDPHLRHRHTSIGHAVSADLRVWDDRGIVLQHGAPESIDETSTWTGSVVKDGITWRMFYTGSRFLDPVVHRNIETITAASSLDLHTWVKDASTVLSADGRWYETLDDGTWHEEAWRDPWIYRAGSGWRMLITARANRVSGGTDPRDAGVVGLAESDDLVTWQAQAPLSAAGSGFGHLEVLQPFEWGGQQYVLFSCDSTHLFGERSGQQGGIWAAVWDDARAEYAVGEARLLADERLYAGRLVRPREGGLALMAFRNSGADGDFAGALSDPIPLSSTPDGWPTVGESYVEAGTK